MHIKISPLTKIISLAGFLALGFLLIILSCALFNNYYPLYDILIFLLAPLPNSLFGISGSNGFYGSGNDFMSDSNFNTGSSGNDLAHFLTGLFVCSGIVLPMVLYHSQLINSVSCGMSIMGGLIIYSSIIIFKWFFQSSSNDDDDNLFH